MTDAAADGFDEPGSEDSWFLVMDPDEQDAYLRHLQRQRDLVRTRERRRCYRCRPVTGRVRRVVSEFATGKEVDPTTAYNLTCRHVTIDVD